MKEIPAGYVQQPDGSYAKPRGVPVDFAPEVKFSSGPQKSEAEIQDEIEAFLKSLGRECYYVRARMDRPTTTACGTPDFLGWINGKPFALECKRPGQKPTPAQVGALTWVELAGAKTAVVDSKQEAIDALTL